MLAKSGVPDGQLSEITYAVGISGLYIGQCNSMIAACMKAAGIFRAGAGILGVIGCFATATCDYFSLRAGGLGKILRSQIRHQNQIPSLLVALHACGGSSQVLNCLRDKELSSNCTIEKLLIFILRIEFISLSSIQIDTREI